MSKITVMGKDYEVVADTLGAGGCEVCAFRTQCEDKGAVGLIEAEARAGVDCVLDDHHYEEVP